MSEHQPRSSYVTHLISLVRPLKSTKLLMFASIWHLQTAAVKEMAVLSDVYVPDSTSLMRP